MNTQVAPAALTISDITVRQDEEGRFNLNDLHKVAGGAEKHKTSNWLRLDQTKELIAEINQGSDLSLALKVTHGGNKQGTYVVRELVYAYAMWISASFSLKVIRAYDALVTTPKSTDTELYEPVIPFNKDYVLLNIVQFYSGEVVKCLVPLSLLSKGAIDREHVLPMKKVERLSLNTHAQDDFKASTARKDNTDLPELVDELGNILNAYESLYILSTESNSDAFYCNSILLPINNQFRALFKRFKDKIVNQKNS